MLFMGQDTRRSTVPEMMKDLEEAYRTLDLKHGATLKEVIEAREDLLALWNPDRLSGHPRLRSKAGGKIREINEAYDVLMERLGRTGLQTSSKIPQPSVLKPENVDATAALPSESPSTRPTASLLDEVFSEKRSKDSRQILLWSAVTLGMIAVLAIGYFLRPTGPDKSEKSPEISASAETLPAALPGATQEPGEEGAERAIGRAARKLGSPLLEFVSAIPNSTEFAPTIPPPRPAKKEDRKDPSQRKSPAKPGQAGQQPVLVRGEVPSPVESAGTDARKELSPEEERSRFEQAEKSYRSLLSNSPSARRLVEGGLETLRFTEWKVVQRKASEIWIDLIANQSNGGLVHFIWSVNVEKKTVRPLSEAARNLERGQPPK